MSIIRQTSAESLALVVMAAGVVTVSPDFTLDTAGKRPLVRLSDTLSGSVGLSLTCTPAACR
jgi:hypothetical protein